MYHDETERLKIIASALEKHQRILVPDNLTGVFDQAYQFLSAYRTPSPSPDVYSSHATDEGGDRAGELSSRSLPPQTISQLSSPVAPASPSANPSVTYNVRLSNKTTLDALYTYAPGVVLEYPQTHKSGTIGHLFHMSQPWYNPARNFVYSQGEPRGASGRSKTIFIPFLVDEDGKEVPCQESHSTCTS